MTSRTVLVADDDRLLRESLCDAFAELGCQPRAAGCGSQAIEALEHFRCDLLLSDVDMPDMSGFQLLSWVREHHQHHPIPAVLMSARADGQLRQAAITSGAIDLLTKPVEIGSIATLYHHLFDRRPSA